MKNFVTYLMIFIAFSAMVFGCNVQKRSLRKVQKAVRIDKPTVDKYFADNYNITDSIDTRIVYREGKTLIDTFTEVHLEVINDTVYKIAYKTINKLQRDTVYNTKFEKVRDGSKEAFLQAENKELAQTTIKQKQQIKTARNIGYILGIAWVLFFVGWFIKSKFKIFG